MGDLHQGERVMSVQPFRFEILDGDHVRISWDGPLDWITLDGDQWVQFLKDVLKAQRDLNAETCAKPLAVKTTG